MEKSLEVKKKREKEKEIIKHVYLTALFYFHAFCFLDILTGLDAR